MDRVEAVRKAIPAAQNGAIVTFGIRPDRPHTGYGYIKVKETAGSLLDVEMFVEKPDLETAKSLMVKPGKKLSLQKHAHRSEHWVLVKGAVEVTLGEEISVLCEIQSTFIPQGSVHRLHNPGKFPAYLIEVQSENYLGEDDIQRLEDDFNRVDNK